MQKQGSKYKSLKSTLNKIFGQHFNIFAHRADNLSNAFHCVRKGAYTQLFVSFKVCSLLVCLFFVYWAWCYFYSFVLLLFASFLCICTILCFYVLTGVTYYAYIFTNFEECNILSHRTWVLGTHERCWKVLKGSLVLTSR